MDQSGNATGWAKWLAVVVLAGAPFLVYSNTLKNPFVADDIDYIARSQDVINYSFPDCLGKLRPLTKLTYHLNRTINKQRMPGYHLVNISLHAGACVLLFFLFRRLLDGRNGTIAAFAGALLFAMHPIHTQAVNYIFARSELLCAVFLFSALLVHAKPGPRYGYGRGAAVAGLLLLALASKERAFMFVPALVLFDIIVRDHDTWPQRYRRWLKVAVPLSLVVLVGLANFYFGFKDQHRGAIGEGQEVPELLPYFLTEMVVRFHYLKLYLWPADLSFDYLFTLRTSFTDPVLLAATAGHAALFVLALFLARRAPLISFGIFWFFLLLLPTSGVVPTAWLMHEHWIYLPSFGIFLILANLLQRGFAPAMVKGALVAGLAMLLGFTAHQRNKVWHDPLTLWLHASKNAPDRAWLWNHVGVACLDRGRLDDALEYFERSEALGGSTPAINQCIGLCLLEMGDLDGAKKRLDTALKLFPGRAETLVALGRLHLKLEQYYRAVDYFEKAHRNGLTYPPGYFISGAEIALSKEDHDKAVKFLKMGLKQYPRSKELKKRLEQLEP